MNRTFSFRLLVAATIYYAVMFAILIPFLNRVDLFETRISVCIFVWVIPVLVAMEPVANIRLFFVLGFVYVLTGAMLPMFNSKGLLQNGVIWLHSVRIALLLANVIGFAIAFWCKSAGKKDIKAEFVECFRSAFWQGES